jgi:hypothetical protein
MGTSISVPFISTVAILKAICPQIEHANPSILGRADVMIPPAGMGILWLIDLIKLKASGLC